MIKCSLGDWQVCKRARLMHSTQTIYRFNQPRLYNYEDVLANPMDEKLCETIRKQNVLVIDDVNTSSSTLNEILRSLRIVNDDNNITIFSLIGRKDLMADSF